MPLLRGMLALLACLVCSGPVLAGTEGVSSFQFDGSTFREGRAPGAILIKDGFLPLVAGEGGLREDPLPSGTGAVVLLCYRQVSGGKLGSHAGYAPMPAVAVVVSSASLALAARADANGYLILALPAGSYQLSLFGISKRVTIEKGKSALVSIRGGKRMVD